MSTGFYKNAKTIQRTGADLLLGRLRFERSYPGVNSSDNRKAMAPSASRKLNMWPLRELVARVGNAWRLREWTTIAAV